MANSCFQLLLFFPLFLMFVSLEASRFSSNSSNSKPSCIEIERKALVEFKKGLTDPSGLLSSWVGNDCCTWMGIGCSNQTGNVVALELGNLGDCYDKKIGYAPATNSSCLGGEKCKGLTMLDLGENRFYGNIPKYIGQSFSSLLELRIRDNMFSGNIPAQLCSLAHLHILDLALNNLSGSIPSCLGKLGALNSMISYSPHQLSLSDAIYQQMEMELVVKGRQLIYTFTLELVNIIDLSSNNLQGEIPELITNLSTLGTLNLSHNRLTGKIPEKIGGLQRLETLDLSCNHLSGPIPSTMSSMTSLNNLNLSFNNLSGPIPSGNQFETFIDPSIYEGNPELCGPPLSTKCLMPNDRDADANQHAKAHKDEDENEDENENDNLGFYLGMALGFVVGFWAVCGSLMLKKSWRYTYFGCVDKMKDWLFVVVMVNLNRLRRRMMGAEHN